MYIKLSILYIENVPEVPLYNEFVTCFSYFFIIILTNNVFRDDEEDKIGASMTHTMIDIVISKSI